MQRFLLRICVSAIAVLVSVLSMQAQVADTTNPTSVDPKLLEWKNSKIPKEYTIADVVITGIKHLDTSIVYSITNLHPGDKFIHPGADVFAKSIAALWRQRFFSGIQVYVTKIQDNKIWIEIAVVERYSNCINIFLNSGINYHFRCLPQTCVYYFHTYITKKGCYYSCAPVVTI